MHPFTHRTCAATLGLALLLLVPRASVAQTEAETPRIFLDEGFDAYATTEGLLTVWKGGSAVLELTPPGGGKAAAHDGGELNDYKGFSVRPDATRNVTFCADFYDYATNSDKRVTALLKNGSGASIEFGLLNEYGPYCFRVVGLSSNDLWQPFADDLQPVKGWHRFQAVVSTSNIVVMLDLGRNGNVDHRFTLPVTLPKKAFNTARFGGLPGKLSHGGPVLVDNIRVVLSPASLPLVMPPPASPVANAPLTQTISSSPDHGWSPALWGIVAGLAVIIGLLAVLVLTIRRHSHPASSALVPVGGNAMTRMAAEGLPQDAALREKLMPELAEFAKHSLVQGLYSQRNELLETQKQAQAYLSTLEERLATLHLPLQERIRAYENRITELEKGFESRDEELRELTRATLALVRQRLDEEREKVSGGHGSRFN